MIRKSMNGFAQISPRNLRTLHCDMETSDLSDVLKKNMLQPFNRVNSIAWVIQPKRNTPKARHTSQYAMALDARP